jgi:alkylation response protein AidB-like acyl-CoA dehydrogenase
MGHACVPAPFFSTVMLGAYPLLDSGTEDQKREYLPRIASGAARFTMSVIETDGRYEAQSIRTKATPAGSDFIIEGTKLFVPSAAAADRILCVARTADKAGPEDGITVFIVDAKSPGIKTTLLKTIDNEKIYEVSFNKVRVSADDILGRKDGGWELVRRTVKRAAVAVCCDILGVLQQVLDMTVQYAKDRKQFDQPIGKFQIVQHYCADMAADIDGLKYVTYRAAWISNESQPSDLDTGTAKVWAVQAGERVLALAHQIHGAIGVTIDHDLQYYTKRFKAASAMYGDEDFYREKVAVEMGL